MNIAFKRKTKEKLCERDGRVIAECRVALSLPYFEGEEAQLEGAQLSQKDRPSARRGESAPERIRELLLSFFNAALSGADGIFSAASEEYEKREGGKHFWGYRLSVEISPSDAPTLDRQRCFSCMGKSGKAKSKKQSKLCYGECLEYVIYSYLSRRGRVIYRHRLRIAFRLCDGYLCTLV